MEYFPNTLDTFVRYDHYCGIHIPVSRLLIAQSQTYPSTHITLARAPVHCVQQIPAKVARQSRRLQLELASCRQDQVESTSNEGLIVTLIHQPRTVKPV